MNPVHNLSFSVLSRTPKKRASILRELLSAVSMQRAWSGHLSSIASLQESVDHNELTDDRNLLIMEKPRIEAAYNTDLRNNETKGGGPLTRTISQSPRFQGPTLRHVRVRYKHRHN